MSKSDIDRLEQLIFRFRRADPRKNKKAMTDSEPAISGKVHGEGNGAVQNLLTIYAAFPVIHTILRSKSSGKNLRRIQKDLAELLVEKLKPIQQRYQETRSNKQELERF